MLFTSKVIINDTTVTGSHSYCHQPHRSCVVISSIIVQDRMVKLDPANLVTTNFDVTPAAVNGDEVYVLGLNETEFFNMAEKGLTGWWLELALFPVSWPRAHQHEDFSWLSLATSEGGSQLWTRTRWWYVYQISYHCCAVQLNGLICHHER